jgi:hypothetical protein
MLRKARQADELPEPEEEPEPETADFAFLTVREQLAAANTVADKISDMEQLQTDLTESTPDDLLTVRLEWIGRDNERHCYDLLCSGADTASECLAAAAARESHMLRRVLSRQCAMLSGHKRSTQNRTQNDYKPEGEWYLGKAMRRVRMHDLDG